MRDTNHTESKNYSTEYKLFFNHFGKNFSQLTSNKKEELIEVGLNNLIRILKKRLGDNFEDNYSMNEIYFYGTMKDQEFDKNQNEEKFRSMFGSKFTRCKEELKNNLLDFGFDNFIKICKERKLSLGENNLYFLYEMSSYNDEDFEYQVNYNLYVEKFGTKFYSQKEELIEEMIKYGFHNFMKDIEDKGIDHEKYTLQKILYMLESNEEEQKYDEEYEKFLRFFGSGFSKNKEEKIDSLIKIGFDEIKRFIDEESIDLDFYNSGSILGLYNMDKKERWMTMNYDLFRDKYLRRFTNFSEEFQDELCRFGFKRFHEEIERLGLDENDRLSFIYEKIKNNGDTEFDKFREEFGQNFTLVNDETISEACEFGFDNFMRIYNERKLDIKENGFSYCFYLVTLNESEYEKEIESQKFISVFGKSFNMIYDDKREILLSLGFDLFMERINKRMGGYKKGVKFYDYFNCGIMNDEEYSRRLDAVKFQKEYGQGYSQLSDDVIEGLLDYGFDKFQEDLIKEGIDESFRLSYKLELLKKNKDELKLEKEEISFRNYFGSKRITSIPDHVLKRFLDLGLNKFLEISNKRKLDLNSKQLYLFENEILFTDEEYERILEENKFKDFFGTKFDSLLKEKKEDLLDIGFDEFMNLIKNRIGEYDKDQNMSDIYDKCVCSDEEFNKKKEYENFYKEYGNSFSTSNKDFIEELISYGFDNFENEIKKKGIKELDLRSKFYLINLKDEDFKKEIELRKFKKEFGEIKFNNYLDSVIDGLCEYGFDNFMKDLKDRGISFSEKDNLGDLLRILNKDEEELYSFVEYQKFSKEYGPRFRNSKERGHKILCEYGFDNFQNTLKEKDWINVEDFSLSFLVTNIFHLNKEEYKEMKEIRKFVDEYGSEFTNISSDMREKFSKLGFEEFKKQLKEKYWISEDDNFGYIKDFFFMNSEEYEDFKNKRILLDNGIQVNSMNELKSSLVKGIGEKKLIEILTSRGLSINGFNFNLIIGELIRGETINNDGDKYICKKCGYKGDIDSLTVSRIHNLKNPLGNICERCFPRNYRQSSQGERELFEFIYENYSGRMISGSRVIEKTEEYKNYREIDIHLIHDNIGFEYNGTYWHGSEESKRKDEDKINQAKKQGIKIFVIEEEDWTNNRDMEKERIIKILKEEGLYSPRDVEKINKIREGLDSFNKAGIYLSQLDNEIEFNKIKEFFGEELIEKQRKSSKNELNIFGFSEIERRMNKRGLNKEFIKTDFERNIYRYVLVDDKDYLFNIEEDKFINKFGEEFSTMTVQNKEKFVYLGFKEFMKYFKEENNKNFQNSFNSIVRKIYKQKEL